MQQHQDPGYGKYEGSPNYGQQYEAQPQPQPQPQGNLYDDEFASSIAQRVGTGQGATGRGYARSQHTSSLAGMRLALAIVSICVLVPIAGIIFGIMGGGGLVPFVVACAAIVLVNAIFNSPGLLNK